jgi:formate-dependent phosphoribosylglycinamide formyltransferase (GAR transformylase)
VKTVLFVGAGRHQRRAILRAKELGLRVVAVDRNPEAPGSQARTSARRSTSPTSRRSPRSRDATRRRRPDRLGRPAVPVVAAVAEALGLPGIGTETAHLMTHKIAMRRTLADAACRSRASPARATC